MHKYPVSNPRNYLSEAKQLLGYVASSASFILFMLVILYIT